VKSRNILIRLLLIFTPDFVGLSEPKLQDMNIVGVYVNGKKFGVCMSGLYHCCPVCMLQTLQ